MVRDVPGNVVGNLLAGAVFALAHEAWLLQRVLLDHWVIAAGVAIFISTAAAILAVRRLRQRHDMS